MNVLRIIQEILSPFAELEVNITVAFMELTFTFFYEMLNDNMNLIFTVFVMNWNTFPEGILAVFLDFLSCIMWNNSETRRPFPVDNPWDHKLSKSKPHFVSSFQRATGVAE